eukprot:m.234512 g.234512  ORF g.234512 m.234512 type:complete len:612 (-) comp12669_c0_seq1:641-2476(-)
MYSASRNKSRGLHARHKVSAVADRRVVELAGVVLLLPPQPCAPDKRLGAQAAAARNLGLDLALGLRHELLLVAHEVLVGHHHVHQAHRLLAALDIHHLACGRCQLLLLLLACRTRGRCCGRGWGGGSSWGSGGGGILQLLEGLGLLADLGGLTLQLLTLEHGCGDRLLALRKHVRRRVDPLPDGLDVEAVQANAEVEDALASHRARALERECLGLLVVDLNAKLLFREGQLAALSPGERDDRAVQLAVAEDEQAAWVHAEHKRRALVVLDLEVLHCETAVLLDDLDVLEDRQVAQDALQRLPDADHLLGPHQPSVCGLDRRVGQQLALVAHGDQLLLGQRGCRVHGVVVAARRLQGQRGQEEGVLVGDVQLFRDNGVAGRKEALVERDVLHDLRHVDRIEAHAKLEENVIARGEDVLENLLVELDPVDVALRVDVLQPEVVLLVHLQRVAHLIKEVLAGRAGLGIELQGIAVEQADHARHRALGALADRALGRHRRLRGGHHLTGDDGLCSRLDAAGTLRSALLHHHEIGVVVVGELRRRLAGLGHRRLARAKCDRCQAQHVHPRLHLLLVLGSKDILACTVVFAVECLERKRAAARVLRLVAEGDGEAWH